MSWKDIVKNDFGGGRYENKKIEYPHQLHNYTAMFNSDMNDYMKILKQFIDSEEKLPRSKSFHRIAKEIYAILDEIDLYAYSEELSDRFDEEAISREGRR